jgi:hypothetical protein
VGSTAIDRALRLIFAGATLALSWLVMMAVHESGHALAAWLSGGAVARVVLDPTELSHTELSRNPHPLFVAWSGVLWGSLLPVFAFWLMARRTPPTRQLAGFLAGFCCVANGTYLAAGVFTGAGGPGDIGRHGAATGVVLIVGLGLAALGLVLWHRLGPHFGFVVHRGAALRRKAVVLTALLVAVVALELVLLRPP